MTGPMNLAEFMPPPAREEVYAPGAFKRLYKWTSVNRFESSADYTDRPWYFIVPRGFHGMESRTSMLDRGRLMLLIIS